MLLKFYNTYTKEVEEFTPIQEKKVKMYSCGPTVYNYPHIGNYRAYVFADVLKRALMLFHYEVKHIMNITDIDDKTIRDSQKENKSLKDFTEFYTDAFLKDIDSLNIIHPEKFTKATDYVDEMVKITEELVKKGFAYKSTDGSTYFEIKKFKDYGKLANIKIEEQKENAGGRIKNDEYDKENIQDFALWKAYEEKDGEVFWQNSLGKGRPGWHIECSAMAIANLGEEIDIHTGGVDNIFPHHENEIAQSECFSGKKFVRYWMHNEWILVDNKKMSKSLGNFYTLRDLINKNINPLAYRLWLLTASYRTRVNFTMDSLEGVSVSLKKLYDHFLDLGEDVGEIEKTYQKRFAQYIANDLDTPKALALMWELLKDESVKKEDKKATLFYFDKIFGLGLDKIQQIEIPEEIQNLLEKRKTAKENKDFIESDNIRKQIEQMGYQVKDTSEGQKVSKF